jgi:hypothetical protein
MIDLKRFNRLNAKGLCNIYRQNDDVICVSFERFDPETGEKMKPEENFSNVNELLTKKNELEEMLSAINAIFEKI